MGNNIRILLLALLLMPLKPVLAGDLLAPQLVLNEASTRFKASLENENMSKDFPTVFNNVTTIIEPFVNFERISMLVLGKQWKKATPEQRVEFTEALR